MGQLRQLSICCLGGGNTQAYRIDTGLLPIEAAPGKYRDARQLVLPNCEFIPMAKFRVKTYANPFHRFYGAQISHCVSVCRLQL